MTTNHITAGYLQEAYQMGRQAAYNAASWIEASEEGARKLLEGLEDGDPEVWDFLPETPNLSGEWADDPTPARLAEDLTGLELTGSDADSELIDAIADEFERGVSEHFEIACELELRKYLPDEITNQRTDA